MTVVQQSTTNYDRFVMNRMNRTMPDGKSGILPRKDLVDSMKREGFWRVAPLICTKLADGRLNIVEGHNRFVAARHLGLPVEFLAYDDADKISPLKFSKSQKAWSHTDIAVGYTQEGNAHYAEVLDFHRLTGIPLSCAFSMFFGDTSSSGASTAKVKAGTFKVKDRSTPWLVASIVEDIGKRVTFATHVNLVHAISKAVFAEGFEPARMREKIARYPEMLRKCRTVDEYIDMLENLYNRHQKGGRYLLRAEIEKAMRARSVATK